MWTAEEDDQLRALHAEGLSFGVIGKRIGNKTRCAVAGMVSRLKLPGRIGNIREAAFRARLEQQGRRDARIARLKARRDNPPPIKRETNTDLQALIDIPTNNFLSQKPGLCKWPHGDECQCAALPMKPYCSEHHERSRVRA